MDTLQLHSLGKNDYVKALKERFNSLKKFVLGDATLNKKAKQKKVKNLKESLKKDIKDADKNLY